MKSELTLRKAKLEEAPRLTEIAFNSKKYWKYSKELMRLWEDDLTITSDFISANFVQCAEIESTIIGFYALSRSDSHFELEHLWVSPNHIGKGYGSELFNDAISQVSNRGGDTLKICSDPNAEDFYLKKGAKKIGTAPSKPAGRTLPLLELKIK
ncbi:MAG: GNAT family N-acetyltransferase [Balneolaceae bacterium]|nr:GNAT family N-acetyltransferase [Balneolaceae bacterium]